MIELLKKAKKKNILLLDFKQETNSGDAAIQIGIVKLFKEYFANYNLYVSTRFGANQFPEASAQLTYTSKDEDIKKIVGGLYNTDEILEVESKSYKKSKINKMLILLLSLGSIFFIPIKSFHQFYKWILPKNFKESFEVFYNADFVIWGSRNFRGNSFWSEPYKFFTIYFNPLICILLNKPIVCISASFWEIKNPISIFMTRFIFKRCLFVSVRERYSYENIKKVLGSDFKNMNLFYFPDLSLCVLKQFMSEFIQGKNRIEKLIGLTIVGSRELQTKENETTYINSFGKMIRKLYKEGFRFVIIPQVTYTPENNSDVLDKIIKISMVPDDAVKIIEKRLTIKELLYEYSRLDFLIASRMHSAIFALMVETPVLSLSYDTGPKWGILEEMGVPKENIIAISDLSKVDLYDNFCLRWSLKENLVKKVKGFLNKEFLGSVDNHIIYAKKFYDNQFK